MIVALLVLILLALLFPGFLRAVVIIALLAIAYVIAAASGGVP
jgi:hypothetical protein